LILQRSEGGEESPSPLGQTPTPPSLSESDKDEAVFIKGESPQRQPPSPLPLSDEGEFEQVETKQIVEEVNLIKTSETIFHLYIYLCMDKFISLFFVRSGENG